MKRLFISLTLLLIVVSATAQNDKDEKQTSSGYYSLTQLSLIVGEARELSAAMFNLQPSITTICGYRLNNYFGMGAGIGIASYEYMVFPVFADFRINIFNENFTPILAVKCGYSLAKSGKELFTNNYYDASYENTGGLMFNPEIGFKTTINKHFDFLFTIGYYYQELESKITQNYMQNFVHNIKTNVNRVSFTIGFLFN
ncbi:MAG: hypothetical protein LBC68_00275 [Prevotellaceae bacterium]|jgi:hypothetical protein|nr:hypothetical protein [Prevotellaceae bacterium]